MCKDLSVCLYFPGSLAGKEPACNSGDPGSIPGSGRSAGEGIGTLVFMGFPGGSAGEESTCNVRDLGLIPGLGRSPGEGKGYPLQHSGLENSMDWIVHGVAKSRTRLSSFHFTSLLDLVGPVLSLRLTEELPACFLNIPSVSPFVLSILSSSAACSPACLPRPCLPCWLSPTHLAF